MALYLFNTLNITFIERWPYNCIILNNWLNICYKITNQQMNIMGNKHAINQTRSLVGSHSYSGNMGLGVRLLSTVIPSSLQSVVHGKAWLLMKKALHNFIVPICMMEHLLIDICNCQSFAQLDSRSRASWNRSASKLVLIPVYTTILVITNSKSPIQMYYNHPTLSKQPIRSIDTYYCISRMWNYLRWHIVCVSFLISTKNSSIHSVHSVPW